MSDDQELKTDHMQDTLYDAYQIVERAKLITDGPPFWMCCDDDFAEVIINGAQATLRWPEAHSGYYDSCSIEVQTVSFPSELLLMSVDEIKKWKIEQREKYDADQQAKKEREALVRAENTRLKELELFASLQAKYGSMP